MKGGGQLDHAEARAKVPAGDRNGVDGFLAQLVSHLTDLFDLKLAQVFRGPDGVEEWRFTEIGHSDIPILHVRE